MAEEKTTDEKATEESTPVESQGNGTVEKPGPNPVDVEIIQTPDRVDSAPVPDTQNVGVEPDAEEKLREELKQKESALRHARLEIARRDVSVKHNVPLDLIPETLAEDELDHFALRLSEYGNSRGNRVSSDIVVEAMKKPKINSNEALDNLFNVITGR